MSRCLPDALSQACVKKGLADHAVAPARLVPPGGVQSIAARRCYVIHLVEAIKAGKSIKTQFHIISMYCMPSGYMPSIRTLLLPRGLPEHTSFFSSCWRTFDLTSGDQPRRIATLERN